MQVSQIAENLFVCGQITEAHLALLADEGFTHVICHRPDAEHPEDAPSASMGREAGRLGMAFHYNPIVPGEPFANQAQQLAAITAKPDAKVLAYCRSGARAANAWALAQSFAAGAHQSA